MKGQLKLIMDRDGEVELENFTPFDARFCINILLGIGLDDEKMDYFELKVCSTKWLELSSKPILLRHTLIVDNYNYNDILRSIEYYISQCEDSSWKNISLKLSRYFLWEFEDYIEE
ncbi:Imm8 family immunity protein [Aggregatibacter sp. HMT-949]|uniref:Imm8 family immunity protein n=1 Tax=Aggregatibacter sp. HMT-949 TaxID=3235088 RepID=UPI00359C2154